MQMASAPTHYPLQNDVQSCERHILGHEDAAPYERLDVHELDSQLAMARGRLGAASRFSATGSN